MSLVLRYALSKGIFLSLCAIALVPAKSGELAPPRPANAPKVAPASNEGEMAMKGMQLPPGFKVELFAAEPDLANPVAFDIDRQNRFWVAETFRLHAGVSDIRGKRSWLDEDLASRTVDERIAMMKRHEGQNFLSYELNSERLKLIEDTNGDRKADRSSVFADGFSTAADGIASGVLSFGDKVYFANIPHLWELRDTNADGVSDLRKSLHYGFGVRVGFLGHDLHGLIVGPDGKLYFTIGDRGANIELDGRRVGDPDRGSVFRCNLDGSDLELFANGLRNPQELAFDQFGNLFTGDNNSDGGDRARLVHLVEGADSGWHVGFQAIERPNARGPWNAEKMWHPQNPDQPAFLIPPIANLADGPSGFAFYPGTGLPKKYLNHFFLVDFHGGRSSGIHSFTLQPKGAGFELGPAEKFIWNALPTDVAFGPEGGLYFSDWVQGWGMTGKGRIYRVFEPSSAQASIVAETKRLLLEGMARRSISELQKLLAHQDMRVRQDAQFELVIRADKGLEALRRTAASSPSLARIHAIWGLAQIARHEQANLRWPASQAIRRLAADKEPEIRAQAAKAIGDARLPAADETLSLLGDSSPRVRMFAALAAGKIADPKFLPALVKLLEDNNDADPILRHAGSFALAGFQQLSALEPAARHASPAVRMGALLALRRLGRAEIAAFLDDREPALVLEAARAINDLPIPGATRELAALAQSSRLDSFGQPLLRRVVNANYRYGTQDSAKALASLAGNDRLPPEIRAEALDNLAQWERPSGRDNVTGLWRPVVGPRSERHALDAIQPALANLILSGPDAVRIAAANLAGRMQIAPAAESLAASVKAAGPGAPRVAALRALAALNDSRLSDALEAAHKDENESLRQQALRIQSQLKPAGALGQIEKALQSGTLGEKQNAFAALGSMQDKAAADLLMAWLEKMEHEQVQPELQLDLIEAAAKHENNEALRAKLEHIEKYLARGGDLAPFRVSLAGGNPVEGRKIFFERAEASCLRCHKIAGEIGEGGGVGPELTHIGSQRTREHLLESIVLPNKQIAEGFENLLVTTKQGGAYAGIVKSENDSELVLNSPEDGIVTIKKSDIAARERGLSSMPEGMPALLSRRDLRDLVEYLSSLK